MNKQECDILTALLEEPFINQRILSETSGHSLGVVNRSIKELIKKGYLDEEINLTLKAKRVFEERAPQNAVILAAGFGMRMVPINREVPKALLKINGEVLIERMIRQLHEVGIREIYIVVGFMKEQFEYLIDKFDVKLLVNSGYVSKNNLHSMKLVLKYLSNTYVMPCDVWCDQNPFKKNELYSWYMVSDLVDNESDVRVNRKMELVSVPEGAGGNAMIGISYLVECEAALVRSKIEKLCTNGRYDNSFWEEALYDGDRMIVRARVVHSMDVVEINTYEQLRELDENSSELKSEVIAVIARQLGVRETDIVGIEVLKRGMTNRSFLFRCEGIRYIMRIPGEGTDILINRKQEAEVYTVINGLGLCDPPIYLDASKGYKITRYIEGVRCCDPNDASDLKLCMKKLKSFHEMKLKVEHEFDIFKMIDFYESLWSGKSSIYGDYEETKKNILSLKPFIERNIQEKVLTHIDAVPDNFLFDLKAEGDLFLQLTDWEYAGMQDPHVDIAMFCIYSFYDKDEIDWLVNVYFEGKCPENIRTKIYCYIASCGLLWSNWCEYKRNLGVEFGEYSLRQYRYAKEYYRLVISRIVRDEENRNEKGR